LLQTAPRLKTRVTITTDDSMAEQRKFQAIKGVRDILPPESALWNRVEQTAREVFATYGYGEIRLPILEQTELFARSVGMDTEIVSKEMYTFERKIEFLREAIFRIGDVKESARLFKFLQTLAVFEDNLERGLHLNEVGRTQANYAAAAKLAKIVQNAVIRYSHGSQHPDSEWDDLHERSLELLRTFEIGESQSLRPEATASVCRAYIEHGMHTLPGNVKLYYIGPMFRRERPQKGRYRQFYQIGAEVLGQSDAPAIDAEVIEMLMAYFERAGLKAAPTKGGDGCTLYINSIGCKECRPIYVEKLRAALIEHVNELKADSQRRVETNPLRVLDSKLPEEQAVIEKLPRITDHLCAACREHYAEVKKQLALRGVFFLENWRLVRGLDYYMRTTFEITASGLGSQNAVCGGGRYDGLVELLGGPPTKGIGFAIGTDRLILAIQAVQEEGVLVDQALIGLDVLVTGTTWPTWERATTLAALLRKKGLRVYLPEPGTRVRKAMELANKVGIRAALIVGEEELREGRLTIRILSPFEEGQPRDGSVQDLDREAIAYGRLVKIRAQLERYLKELGWPEVFFHSAVGLRAIVSDLKARAILPEKLAYEIEQFSTSLNAAVHGQTLAFGSLETAVVKGNLLLAEIENLLNSSKDR
jgi:histidyl-tRNA synthetase